MLTIKEYVKVKSLEEAYELNQKRTNHILGGMLMLRLGSRNIQKAIDLSGLGLDSIEEETLEFRIGCMTTLRALETHEGLNAYTGGAVRESLRHIVGVQFRNLATVGGSIFGRFGFSDVLTMFFGVGYLCGAVQGRNPSSGGVCQKEERYGYPGPLDREENSGEGSVSVLTAYQDGFSGPRPDGILPGRRVALRSGRPPGKGNRCAGSGWYFERIRKPGRDRTVCCLCEGEDAHRNQHARQRRIPKPSGAGIGKESRGAGRRMKMEIKLELNGKALKAEIEPDLFLLDFLRSVGMKSVKRGCDTSNCGPLYRLCG